MADSVEAQGRAALPLACDITDDEALATALASVQSRFGRLDALVNNAGGPGKGYGLEKVDRARFDHTLEINLSAAYSLTHQALPCSEQALRRPLSTFPRRWHGWLTVTLRPMARPRPGWNR